MKILDFFVKRTTIYKNVVNERNCFDRDCIAKAEQIRKHIQELKTERSKVAELTTKLNEKEAARRLAAGKVGGLTTKNNQLNKTVKELTSQINDDQKELAKKDKLLNETEKKLDFWKNHKQDTSPFAIQNYFSGAKRKQK